MCPDSSCNKKSVTFEFASTVQLAIPDRNRVRSRSRSRSGSAGLYSYRMERINSRPMISIPVMIIPEVPSVKTCVNCVVYFIMLAIVNWYLISHVLRCNRVC